MFFGGFCCLSNGHKRKFFSFLSYGCKYIKSYCRWRSAISPKFNVYYLFLFLRLLRFSSILCRRVCVPSSIVLNGIDDVIQTFFSFSLFFLFFSIHKFYTDIYMLFNVESNLIHSIHAPNKSKTVPTHIFRF